jgi:four helix bundle protein
MSSKRIQSFRDLQAWQSAMSVAVMAHELADDFPAEQRYALGAEIRRSSTSIPSNIAEGHAHRGIRNYLRHVRIALGSHAELDTQLEIASRLKLIGQHRLEAIASEVNRCRQLLHGLQRALAWRTLGAATMMGAITAAAHFVHSAPA